MLKRIVQLCFLLIGGTLGVFFLPYAIRGFDVLNQPIIDNNYMMAIIGAVLFYLMTFWAIDYCLRVIKWVEDSLVKAPVTDLLFGGLGLILGLLLAFLLGLPFNALEIAGLNTIIPIVLTLLLGYMGFQVGFKRRDELVQLFTPSSKGQKKKGSTAHTEGDPSYQYKILDTSVIIDGRIADICQTRFLEGTIVIPQFVLGELQHIADSSDVLKRNRGRRGLDILNRIQKELPVNVEMYEGDFDDIQEVDSKLIKLAKLMDGMVVTNDYNLNKVCEFQGVPVLNINDLANAVKPVVLPGEEMMVQVIKDGKEHNQGIAYLDDGTMIVVEEGRNYISKRIEVVVTSVLQTSAGRMIFAKPKVLEKAL